MKNIHKIFSVLFLLVLLACDNYTDEMKITGHSIEISVAKDAQPVERSGDHKNSPYFSSVDFYNAKPGGTLTILPKFKTFQQSYYYSCGPAAAMMVLEYFGKLGNNDENSLAKMRPTVRPNKDFPGATDFADMVQIFNTVGGFNLVTTYDTDINMGADAKLEMIENFIKSGTPVLVLWAGYGAHWQVVIGYDNMGTNTKEDDVIIFADSADTTDHNQDGYVIYPAARFVWNWTTGRFLGTAAKDNDFLFIAVKPKNIH